MASSPPQQRGESVDGVEVCVIVGAGSKYDKNGSASDFPPKTRFGLGGALSLEFATKKGYHVLCLGRRKDVMEQVAQCVIDAGGKATALSCDVTDAESVKTAFDVVKSLGKLKVVVL